MNTNSKYTCKFCSREYKLKCNHDRHVQTCEFLSKSKCEQDNELDSIEKIPTQRELFLLIQELSMRIEKLEKENKELKNSVKIKVKRNFSDILSKEPKPNFHFKDWVSMLLNNVEKHLESVYNNDLLYATNELFDYFIEENADNLPIRAYDIKSNIFYIYDIDQSWIQFSNTDFDKLLSSISHHFLVEFNRCWCLINHDRISKEESYKLMYIDYYKKILGGDRLSDENRYKRIRHLIYNKIKKNIRSYCSDDSENIDSST